jgi:hypothetical protein
MPIYVLCATPGLAAEKRGSEHAQSLWLMFLRAGVIPQVGWIDAAEHFIQKTEMRQGAAYAAVFRA